MTVEAEGQGLMDEKLDKGEGTESEKARLLAGEIKEAVDVLETALAGGNGSVGDEMVERALRRVCEIADMVIKEARKAQGRKKGHGMAGDEGGLERILALCMSQCERAVTVLGTKRKEMEEGREACEIKGRIKEVFRIAEGLRLARRLREAREAVGISQAEAAERMDISPAYLSRLERADCNPPSARTRRRIEAFLIDAGGSDGAKALTWKEREATYGIEGLGPGVEPGVGNDGNGLVAPGVRGGLREVAGGVTTKGDAVIGHGRPAGEGGGEGLPGTTARFDDGGISERRSGLLRELLNRSLRLDEEDLELLLELARHLQRRVNAPL